MYEKLKRDKIAQLMFSLLFLGTSGIVSGANVPDWKVDTFSLERAGEISLPVRITPVLVEAPPRHVDLFPILIKVRDSQRVSLPLTGLPVDLYEFSVLKFSATDQWIGQYGIELGLATRTTGVVDTLVRVGDPVLFPDMIGERLDFRSAEFVAKDLGYQIKRMLDIGGDGKWRYLTTNSRVHEITNGVVSASFKSGGELVVQRTFASTELSKTPWLRYEYELPQGFSWVMQINAKIDRGGFSPKLKTLFSEPVMGGGKQKLLVNLYELLQKADPDAKDGRLKELIIHFRLAQIVGSAVQDMHIDLGKLEFYQAQTVGSGNAPQNLLITAVGTFEKKVNLQERLKSLIGPNEWTVLTGRLVSVQQYSPGMPQIPPSISLYETYQYQEKIPELFVGERFFLDELSGLELSAVLDQQMFVEKQVHWESGQSDVVFLKPGRYHPKQGGLALPLLSYTLDSRIDGDAFIKVDYAFEGGGLFPLYLTLSGIDQHGRQVKSDHLMIKNRPLKVKDIRISKIILSFRQEAGAASPLPASCIIKKIQISSFKKTAVYRPKPSLAYVAVNGGVVPDGNFIWRANPGYFDINLRDGENFQTVRSFSVETKIVGDAVIRFDLKPASGGNLAYFLRVRGSDGDGYFEKLFPLNRRDEVRLSNLVLHGLDIAVKGDATPSSAVVRLNHLEVQYLSKSGRKHDKPPQPVASASGEIIYLAPHLALTDSVVATMSSALATELVQLDLTKMNKLDATLSYAQILGGGKSIALPKTFLGQGEHELNYVADEGVGVTIDDQSFLELNRNQRTAAFIKAESGMARLPKLAKAVPSKLAKIGLLILAGVLVVLGVKFMPRWGPLMDRVLSWQLGYWGIQFILFSAALYLMFFDANKNALSWGGLLLVFSYGLAVHYKIRPYLTTKWAFFSERLSAPYFLLFLVLLVFCAVMLMLKLNTAAENTAVILYYLLLTGVAIEFMSFAKETRSDAALSAEKE